MVRLDFLGKSSRLKINKSTSYSDTKENYYMSERPRQPEQGQADFTKVKEFRDRHVYPAADFDAYQSEILQQWKEQALASLHEGKSIRPMWMRRNNESGTFFGACIDYWIPVNGQMYLLAMLDIHSESGPTEIEVYFPSDDGSGEPILATCEMYNPESLANAIELVESQVQPANPR
jgi:hypothetical protein